MKIGMVKVWNTNYGWDFISGDDGDDYFLNANNIRPGQKMEVGDCVRFDVNEKQQGPAAEKVTHA